MTAPAKPWREPLLVTWSDPETGTVFSAVSQEALALHVVEFRRYQLWKLYQEAMG